MPDNSKLAWAEGPSFCDFLYYLVLRVSSCWGYVYFFSSIFFCILQICEGSMTHRQTHRQTLLENASRIKYFILLASLWISVQFEEIKYWSKRYRGKWETWGQKCQSTKLFFIASLSVENDNFWWKSVYWFNFFEWKVQIPGQLLYQIKV